MSVLKHNYVTADNKILQNLQRYAIFQVYRFGLTDIQIEKYVQLADLYHALTLLCYGSSKLYPYFMERSDVFPNMLIDLPLTQ